MSSQQYVSSPMIAWFTVLFTVSKTADYSNNTVTASRTGSASGRCPSTQRSVKSSTSPPNETLSTTNTPSITKLSLLQVRQNILVWLFPPTSPGPNALTTQPKRQTLPCPSSGETSHHAHQKQCQKHITHIYGLFLCILNSMVTSNRLPDKPTRDGPA